ncbi:hypothetical protein SEUCBS139899_007094 [Sporothrix eucalyptigena]|uniref:Histone chaperone RTT106/FACT complex subunit SPT16-like middle domain-containing protein n=1 Tax=Sporothrix eucalyptigena TaxID=1812306 RepID=A0ABP0CMP9_9PEZI
MAGLDTKRLSLAFQSRPDLIQQVQAAAAESPAHTKLFNNIANYVCEQLHTDNNGEPAQKRRRVEAEGAAHTNGAALPARQANSLATTQNGGSADGGLSAAAAEPVLLEVKDISVSIPQRKKYDLCFTQNYLYARASNTTAPVPGIVYAWKDIEHVFYLPVPEKAQVQYNYILLPRNAALAALSKPASSTDGTATPPTLPVAEPLVFTVSATAPKPGSVGGPSAGLAASVSDSYTTLFHWAIEGQLRSVGNPYLADKNTIIVATDPKVFHSAARQSFRPTEKAVHVRAFRGSKDGYLFFLPTGILWGFKKPLLFLPLDRIVAVSYTNVLQRTFNIVVEVDIGGGGDNDDGNEEVEFGMLDQEDYNGISESYVQRHRLQDRSMAERRKAKRELAENARGEKGAGGAESEGGGGANGAQEDDGLTELQRAEQQLQDEEDEDEEDYDPGSDGDSDGSGSSSEEEDEDGDGEGGDDDEEEEEEEEGEGGEAEDGDE